MLSIEKDLNKNTVKQVYGGIAKMSVLPQKNACCCSSSAPDTVDLQVMAEKYDAIDGYVPEADYGLGCGIPTQYAKISKGETVLDLGSGAGNDCFIASKLVGDSGKVIGVDMTEEMVTKANSNKVKLGFKNVEFLHGEIEELPVSDNSVDVAISNCVMNLVPDKNKGFSEIFRVLKLGARMTVSDIVLTDELPDEIRKDAAMYAGCVAGALHIDDYLAVISASGFSNIKIVKEKDIFLPDEILAKYMNENEIRGFREKASIIKSITVYGEKI